MIIYRYEKEDGGGPYFTPDGRSRTHPDIYFNDDILCGAESIDNLNKWFIERNSTKLIQDCKIVKYEGELIRKFLHSGEVVIRKSTSKQLTSPQNHDII